MLSEVVAGTVAVVLMAVPLWLWSRRLNRRARALVNLGIAAHILAAIAMVAITRGYYGYGDMLAYHRNGAWLADLMWEDFGANAPDVLKLLLHMPNQFVEINGNGRTTGTMHAVSAILCFIFDDSLLASCLFLSLVAATGKVAMFAAFRRLFPPAMEPRIAICCLLIPSFVFWTGGVLKESVAIAGLGWMVWGAVSILLGPRRGRGIAALLTGGLVVGLTKAYILFPFALAAAAAYYWSRSRARAKRGAFASRPLRLAFALVLGVASMSLLSALFPKYSTENLTASAENLREVGLTHAGGSTFKVRGPVGGGVAAHIAFTPVAMATTLFRPFLFEVKSPLMLFGALEMTAILLLLIRSIFGRGLRGCLAIIRSSPVLMFCLVFTLVFAVAVGLATTNMGSLSRYRAPMMPFYTLLVAALLPAPRARRRRLRAGPRRSSPVTSPVTVAPA